MSLETLIGKLSCDEKLAVMDLLWADLAGDPRSFVSPRWHEPLLSERLANTAPGGRRGLADAHAEAKESLDAGRSSR
jgi:hypothetical protein